MLDLWWNSMDAPMQVFYGVAIATSFLMVLQLAAMMLGLGHGGDHDFGGHDGDVHFDMDADFDTDVGEGGFHGDMDHGDSGLHLLSVRTITAFLMGFGWTGVSFLGAGFPLVATIFISMAMGTAFSAMVLVVMRWLYGLQASGTLNYRNAIGAVGKVYLPIPADMERPGQIEVMIQGRLSTVQAVSGADRDIAFGERVRVTGLLDQGTLVVEPLNPARSTSKSSGSAVKSLTDSGPDTQAMLEG